MANTQNVLPFLLLKYPGYYWFRFVAVSDIFSCNSTGSADRGRLLLVWDRIVHLLMPLKDQSNSTVMKPAVDEMFPEGAGPYVDLDEVLHCLKR